MLDDTLFFDIGIERGKEEDSSDDEEENDKAEEEENDKAEEEEEEIEVPTIQKRQKTANTMIGGVRKGKYSIC